MVDGRGSPAIYDSIAELIGDDTWSYEHVLPYFKKMETYNGEFANTNVHGYKGWLNIKPSTVKAPLHEDLIYVAQEVTGAPIRSDMSDPSQSDGVGIVEVQITNEGKRSSAFADLLVPQLQKSKNIVILFNTLVTKILIDKIKGKLTAKGVECFHKAHAYLVDDSENNIDPSHEKRFKLFAGKEVILCGGAINSPQLLLLSGIGPREHLTKTGVETILDRPGVGSHLMDHNEVAINYEIDTNKLVWPAQAATIINKIDGHLQNSDDNKDYWIKLRNYLIKFADTQEQHQGAGE